MIVPQIHLLVAQNKSSTERILVDPRSAANVFKAEAILDTFFACFEVKHGHLDTNSEVSFP